MDESRPPKFRRRWLRFSLRALLVLVLLLSVPLAWFAWKMDRARRQREVVTRIFELGGGVRYDYQFDEKTGAEIPGAQPTAPLWLRKSLGEDFFPGVTCVNLYGTQVTDAELMHVKRLTSLKWLYLERTQVTDAGLEHLEGLTSLKRLYLESAQVTDEGVKRLQQALPNCEIIRDWF